MPRPHLLGNRQHDHGERHEHGRDEEIIEEAEESLIHIPCHGIGHEGVRQQGEHDCRHRDDGRIQGRFRIVHLCGSIGEIMPLPSCGQTEGSSFGWCLQSGDYGEIQWNQNRKRQHCHGGGKPPIDIAVLTIFLHRTSGCYCSGHRYHTFSLLPKNFSCTKAIIANTMKNNTALAV